MPGGLQGCRIGGTEAGVRPPVGAAGPGKPPEDDIVSEIRRTLYCHLEGRTRSGRVTTYAIMGLIVVSFLAILLETVDGLGERYRTLFGRFEIFVIAVFTLEYLLRLWSCTADPAYARPIAGRLRFAGRFLNLVDLAAILPFYLAFLGIDLRMLRLFRLLRIFKLLRHFEAARILPDVIRRKRQELTISGALVLILLMISATLVYGVEHEAQPDKFSSIPDAMWWAIATLSTVGYGDIAPVTGLGRFFGGIIAVLGIGMFALPAGILAQGFDEAMREARERKAEARRAAAGHGPSRCPHCGKTLEGEKGIVSP